ncbi:MAG: malectin domain-containing carbohydrate-binding protein [Phycisphaerae bacterium]
MKSLQLSAIVLLALAVSPHPSVWGQEQLAIRHATDASMPEVLAARELRRYLYLRTGTLPRIEATAKAELAGQVLIVGSKDRPLVAESALKADLGADVAGLKSQQYLLCSIDRDGERTILIAGGDPIGALYGAYRFIECLGVQFYMHGDVVPDEPMTGSLPSVDIAGRPLFELRGLQPFHDFPEGPDWWNTDEYKSVLSQMTKMGMNFFGLHTYPEGGVGPEPVVWIGMAEDVADDGAVRFSYPSRHFTTTSGTWGYAPKKTGDYNWGAANLFEADDHAPDYMKRRSPWPESLEARNAVFNECAAMLRDAFTYARSLGIKTCVGTETPLTVPKLLREKLQAEGKNVGDPAVVQKLYEGIFTRIARAYPIDYYWLWTPEGWTWSGTKDEEVKATVNDLKAAVEAIRASKAPFTLATCGWVLGPSQDRALFDNVLPKEMPMSCINQLVGKAPVEPGFAKVKGRPTWAIPWLEDDPSLTAPQLWAGRMRRDAFDALRYGCSGLMGIHWRTRNLGPNVSALARAAWDQKGWGDAAIKLVDPPCPEGAVGGQVVTYANNPIADTQDDPLYQSVRYNLSAYRIAVPDGSYAVTLKFCEPHYAEKGKRVFGVKLQGKPVIGWLDVFEEAGQNRALDYTFKDIAVVDGQLVIDFVHQIEFPCIAAIVIEGSAATRRINCGGPAYKDYEADLPTCPTAPRNLPIGDFYADWALAHFGPDAAEPIARIFERIDGHLPEPITWVAGPGGIRPDTRPWEQVAGEYAFVDELAALRPQVRGAGNLERFDYWLNSFVYLRTVAQLNCVWATFNDAMKKAEAAATPEAKRDLAVNSVLPIRREMIRLTEQVYRHLLSHVSTTGELGTVTNWEQHNLPDLLDKPGEKLAVLLGESLPADAMPGKDYTGPPRLFVPVARTSVCEGEPLRLKAIVLAQTQPREVVVFHRSLGSGNWVSTPMKRADRGVYRAELAAWALKDGAIEYYVQAESGDTVLRWPPTGPKLNQTVIVVPK